MAFANVKFCCSSFGISCRHLSVSHRNLLQAIHTVCLQKSCQFFYKRLVTFFIGPPVNFTESWYQCLMQSFWYGKSITRINVAPWASAEGGFSHIISLCFSACTLFVKHQSSHQPRCSLLRQLTLRSSGDPGTKFYTRKFSEIF